MPEQRCAHPDRQRSLLEGGWPFGSALPAAGALPVALVLLLTLTACGGSGPESEGASVIEPSPEPPVLEGLGYQPRGCGFDLDDDGVVGEPEDCRVCDGSTTDPDGDGVDEDLLYVACGTDGLAAGQDAPGCGTPDNPCASLSFAWTLVDGPADGAEDIVCFRGRCSGEELRPPLEGLSQVWTEPVAGSAERPWERSTDPAMLVGWDSDGDGLYPPYDSDDMAVLDGTMVDGTVAGRALTLGEGSHLELAHFTALDFGQADPLAGDGDGAADSGFLAFNPTGERYTHLRVHDLALRGINRDRAAGRRVSTFHLATDTRRLHWLAFENLLVTDNGGAFVLAPGVDGPPDSGPLRWRYISRTVHGCDALDCDDEASSLDFAVSGHVRGIEILDSLWDANVERWLPKGQGGIPGAAFVIAARATQDWLIRNNRILDHKNGLIVRGGASRDYGDRNPRPVDGVVFDRNVFLNRYDRWKYGDFAVEVRDGEAAHELVGSVHLTNNALITTTPWDGCIALRPASDFEAIPGQIVVAHNTCRGPIDRYAAWVLGEAEGQNRAFQQPRIVLRNNLVTGMASGDWNIRSSYAPSELQADGNVYTDGPFSWDGRFTADLAGWQEATGQDSSSRVCEPELAPGEGVDLGAGDRCARDAGVDGSDLGPGLGTDLKGATRPQGDGWDAGADEAAPAASTPPAASAAPVDPAPPSDASTTPQT